MAKALVADDSRAVRMILTKTLKELGYEVCEAANGREALEVMEVERDAVTLVLADWNMPEINGLELLKRLRQNPGAVFAGGDHGHHRNRIGPDGDGSRGGRQRVRHEAVHERHPGGEAPACGSPPLGGWHDRAEQAPAPARAADSRAGGGRLGGHPPPGDSRPRRGPGARGGRSRVERSDRTPANPAAKSGRAHAGHRDAGDGRPGNAAARPARVSAVAGDHVQHAHRARRGGDPGGADPGRGRLCGQSLQRRVARPLDEAPAGRTGPEDQAVLPPAGTEPSGAARPPWRRRRSGGPGPSQGT